MPHDDNRPEINLYSMIKKSINASHTHTQTHKHDLLMSDII